MSATAAPPTVVHVASRVTNGVSCEHFASGYTMNG